jgi:hypothetical protein
MSSPEVLSAAVTGVFLVVVTVLTVLLPRLLARQGRDLRAVRDQVQNSHGTNLRDDIDALRYEMRYGFGLVHERLHKLENDGRQERGRVAQRETQDDRRRAGYGQPVDFERHER